MKNFLVLSISILIFCLLLIGSFVLVVPTSATTSPEIGAIQFEIFPDIKSMSATTVQTLELTNKEKFDKMLPLVLTISTLGDASPVSTIYIDNNTPLVSPIDVPVGKYRIFLKRADRPQVTYEYNNNSNGILITNGSKEIVPLFSNTPLKDVLADIPPRMETTEDVPITLIVKDADELNNEYSVYEIRIYDDKNDDDDDIADDELVYTLDLGGDSCIFASGFENIDEDHWYRIVKISQTNFDNIGGYANIHILFDAATVCDPADWDTHVHLSVRTSGNNLPKLPNWYCGDQHVHSWVTDDIYEFGAPIEAIRDAGKAMGIDYVIITDHSYDIDPFPDEWNDLKSDCESHSSSDFICLAGEEISCDELGITEGASHLLAYGITTPLDSVGIGPDFWYPDEPDQQYAIDFVNGQFGLSYIAHPFGGPDPIPLVEMWDWDDIDSSHGYAGLEVFHEIWQDEYDDRTLDKWIEYLLEGNKIYGVGNSDAHDLHGLGRARTYSYIETFSNDGILDALRNGHSIMTNGPLVIFSITNEYSETAIIGDEIAGNDLTLNIQWESTSEFGNVGHIYVHRGVIGGTEEEIYHLTPNTLSGTQVYSDLAEKIPSSSYIRIEATSSVGEEFHRCYTNPIWVNPVSGRIGGPDDFGYTFKDSNIQGGPTYDWIEISGTGTEVLPDSDDDWVEGINLGFFFNYYGTDYSQLAISNNGLLFSGVGTWQYVNQPITQTTAIHGFVAPFWDDIITLDPQGAGTIYYQTLGTAPNKMFVVEWYDNKHYWNSDSGITFEAILYEGTNNILFQYKDVDFGIVSGAVPGDNPPYENGGSATVGIEGPTGDVGLQYSFNEQVINPGLAILFKFPQFAGTNLYLSKNAPTSKDRGSTITYTLYYHNFGDTAAQNVVLNDTLPSEVEFISASDSGSYAPGTRKVTWDIGSVAPSGHGSMTETVRILESVAIGTVIQNNGRISTSNLEVRYDDNEAHAETTVTGTNLPPDVSVEPNNGGTTPSVVWHTPITFTYYSSCATGVEINIHINDGGPDITGSMTETSPDTWTFTTSFSRTGSATITYTISGCPTPSVSFNIYIDPAGYIYDVDTGARISGASVWLRRPDGQGGWENVPTGQTPPIMQPDTNPLITGADGQYQWDVLEGSYRVHVEAPGYYSADSIVVSVPPPVTDLHVGLTRIPGANLPPVADANSPYGGTEGSPITFNGSGSYDPNDNIASWEWDLDEDGSYETDATATNGIIDHTWEDDYSGDVSLKVTDSFEAIDIDNTTVTVLNVAPAADLGNDGPKDEGSAVTISFSNQHDPGTLDTFTYSFDWNNDGIYELSDQLDASAQYTWYEEGTYTVKGRIKDDDGGYTEYTTDVIVNNVAPIVEAGEDQTVDESETVSFSGSFADPGTLDTHIIKWDFGDGSTTSGILTPTHAYGDNGVYTATLTVTDDDGGVGTDTLALTVNNVAPTVEAGNDQEVLAGDTVSFNGKFTDPGLLDTHTIEWNFGDGTTATGSLTPTHIYYDKRVYEVTLRVTDDDSGVGKDTLAVTVKPIPATIIIEPKTLNLKSRGMFIAFIRLPKGYNAAHINVRTVVCEGAPAIGGFGFHNTFIAWFNVQKLVDVSTGNAVTLTVTGRFFNGTPFEGSDIVRVIKEGRGK